LTLYTVHATIIDVMTNITNTLENIIYGYDPDQFLPIFEDGSLANRSEFVQYKARRLAGEVGHIAYRGLVFTNSVLEELIRAANK
jgi:hypothetical protein